MTEPLKPLTPEQRKDYEAYAIAMGYSDPKICQMKDFAAL